MPFLLLKFQKYIFYITMITSIILGSSLGYFTSVLIRFLLYNEEGAALQNQKPAAIKSRKMTAHKSKAEFDGILTGSFIRNSPPMEDLPPSVEPQQSAEIILLGMIAGDKRWASALIQVQGQKDVEEFYVGESVGGYFILEVRSNSILVEKGGQRMSIEIGEKSAAVKQQRERVVTTESSEDVKKSSISRSQLVSLLNDEAALQQSKVTPFMMKGKMMGLKLIYVPPNHVFYTLGARSGDIIRRFNGEKLDSTGKLIQIYQGLRSMSKATIDLERGGKILTYEFIVTK